MKKVNVVVKKAFRDIYTGLVHKEGETLNVTDARYREINRREKHVEVLKEPAETENKKK